MCAVLDVEFTIEINNASEKELMEIRNKIKSVLEHMSFSDIQEDISAQLTHLEIKRNV